MSEKRKQTKGQKGQKEKTDKQTKSVKVYISAGLFRHLEANAKGFEKPGQTIARLLNYDDLSFGQ